MAWLQELLGIGPAGDMDTIRAQALELDALQNPARAAELSRLYDSHKAYQQKQIADANEAYERQLKRSERLGFTPEYSGAVTNRRKLIETGIAREEDGKLVYITPSDLVFANTNKGADTKAEVSPVLDLMAGQTTPKVAPMVVELPEHLRNVKVEPAPKWIFENGGGFWVDGSERITDYDVDRDIKAGSQPRTTASTKTTTSTPNKSVSTNSTTQRTATPVTQPQTSAQVTPVQVGEKWYGIPSGQFTSGAVTIDPVNVRADNGGLQHAAMNALYKPQNAEMSLGELIAFSSILNGKKDFGGLADVTATMQNADKMNAYAAQQNIANEVQRLMANGRSAEEARYEALTSQLLNNGLDRAAIATTLPEYAKQADARASRDLDATMAAGGDYTSFGSFGYTPVGIRSVSSNGDGTFNLNVNGNYVTDVPTENAMYSVYGAIKGDGSGTKLAVDNDVKAQQAILEMELKRQQIAAETAKANAIANGANLRTGRVGNSGISSAEVQRLYNMYSKAYGPEAAKTYIESLGLGLDVPQPDNQVLGVSVGTGGYNL